MRTVDYPGEIERISEFIKKTVASSGFSSVVIGVSGGIDSAVSLALSVKALGPDHVFVAQFPFHDWHNQSMAEVKVLCSQLSIPADHQFIVPIDSLVQTYAKIVKTDLNSQIPLEKVCIGNAMARIRMLLLFDISKKLQAMVVGTENKSEHYLGYYTRFGDEASDIEPLRSFYKTEVYELAKVLQLPQAFIDKKPSANLWPGQTDEAELGFTYKDADHVIYELIDLKKTPPEISLPEVSPEIVQKVISWVNEMSFKHKLPFVA